MIYKRIRDLREDKDITQEQMGKELNLSGRTYSNYETGKRGIPTDVLIQLADFHHVSIDYLLERTDKKDLLK